MNLSETPTCDQETVLDVDWPKTAVGVRARKLCPGNATGNQHIQSRRSSIIGYNKCIIIGGILYLCNYTCII